MPVRPNFRINAPTGSEEQLLGPIYRDYQRNLAMARQRNDKEWEARLIELYQEDLKEARERQRKFDAAGAPKGKTQSRKKMNLQEMLSLVLTGAEIN